MITRKFSISELEKVAASNKNPSKFDYREQQGILTLLKILKNQNLVEEILG